LRRARKCEALVGLQDVKKCLKLAKSFELAQNETTIVRTYHRSDLGPLISDTAVGIQALSATISGRASFTVRRIIG